jgi:two-component system chemotaxis response regulator CheY
MTTASVLVVDDEPDHRLVARLTLRLGGYDVWEAATGEEALEALTRRHPDAVVLDARLPGIGGLAVLAELRSRPRCATLPVLLCSAHAPASAASVLETDPSTRFLAKPFHPDDLLAQLRGMLGGTSPGGRR